MADAAVPTGPRCIALVGPFQSGKTTLMEALLARTGAIARAGSIEAGTSIGDASAEARHHRIGVELSVATTTFMGDSYTFLDCPGSVEFAQEMRAVLPAVDAAVVVCEADEKKVPQLQLILRELEELRIPRFLFVNKIDKADGRLEDVLALLQPVSRAPLMLRQIPTRDGERVNGFVDLALERAFVYRDQAASDVVDLTEDLRQREQQARFAMLETLADHDDELMAQLLDDIPPPPDRVFGDLVRELREGLVCPVLLGAAQRSNGVLRLLKALRHEAPGVAATRARLGVDTAGDAVAYVMKTVHAGHGGKLSIARVLAGEIGDGTVLAGPDQPAGRVSGVLRLLGAGTEKQGIARAGDTVGLGRLDGARTGETLSSGKAPAAPVASLISPPPVLAMALSARERKDDVKLGQALHKLSDEDPSLTMAHSADSHDVVIRGQGEMHLRVAIARLENRFGVAVASRRPAVGYRETIRKAVVQKARHRKQSGGHGQFGDVVVEIKPLPPGSGFRFEDRITGGVVPRAYIPAVEEGIVEGLKQGPLGFPVVDVAAALIDGSYHAVDSSDMAFRTAGRMAVAEALPQCQPVLLEPIHEVEIVCPSDATARINAILSARRGQILGFDTREDWSGWDVVRAQLPEAEIGDLIVEIRSATGGVGSFTSRFDHMAELVGRAADQIVASRHAA